MTRLERYLAVGLVVLSGILVTDAMAKGEGDIKVATGISDDANVTIQNVENPDPDADLIIERFKTFCGPNGWEAEVWWNPVQNLGTNIMVVDLETGREVYQMFPKGSVSGKITQDLRGFGEVWHDKQFTALKRDHSYRAYLMDFHQSTNEALFRFNCGVLFLPTLRS